MFYCQELASTHQPAKSFIPGHLRYKVDLPPLAPNSSPSYITYLTFDPTGTFLLCNMGFEQVALRLKDADNNLQND